MAGFDCCFCFRKEPKELSHEQKRIAEMARKLAEDKKMCRKRDKCKRQDTNLIRRLRLL